MNRLSEMALRPAVLWVVAIALGISNILPVVFIMNPDGISYLNLTALYQSGHWGAAINGYWSPLYPLLLAATFEVIPASPFYESTVVHVLTFAIYVGAFAAFRFFLSELRLSQHRVLEADENVFVV